MSTWQLAGLTIHLRGGADGRGGGDGPLVVLLHGYGAPGTDLVGLAHELRVPSKVRFAFPEGPLLVPEAGSSDAPGRAWWPLDIARLQVHMLLGNHVALRNDLSLGLGQVVVQTATVLEALARDMHLQPHELVVGGFSQGAVVALHSVLRMQTPPGGLLMMSGTSVDSELVATEAPRFPHLPAVVSHGEFNPILPYSVAKELSIQLQKAGWQVEWTPFRGGHGIGSEVLRAAERLILRVFGD